MNRNWNKSGRVLVYDATHIMIDPPSLESDYEAPWMDRDAAEIEGIDWAIGLLEAMRKNILANPRKERG